MSVVHNEITVPVLGIVYIVAVVIIALQHFTGLDFGVIGIISWIIVIIGAILFILWALAQIFG